MKLYQLSPTRWITAGKIKGSPMVLIRECYPSADSPSGFWAEPGDHYVQAANADVAAQLYLDSLREAQS